MSGITLTGFEGKTAVEIKADLDQQFKGAYGDSLGSESDGSIPAATSVGQEIAIITDAVSSGWEVAQATYAAFDPNQAVFPQLDIICALTGTRRKLAAYSTAIVTCIGVAGTPIPAGSVLLVLNLGTRFDSLATATLALVGTVWANSTAYAVNDLVTVDGKVWQCTVAGTSAALGAGPTGAVGSTFVELTGVTWYALALDTAGVALVGFEAEQAGPLSAAVGALAAIATPVSGWQGAYNAQAATLGRDLETDPALRARRVLELQAQGGGPADAIRADLLAISTVTACVVFVNSTDAVDADGVPAHGVEVLILAPLTTPTTDDELGLAVWRAVGAGTATGGSTTVTITDASGNPQSVSFSRPVEVPIYPVLHAYYDPAVWTGASASTSVAAAVKAAILNLGTTYTIGEDVRSSPIAGAAIDGVYAVTATGDAIYPAPAGSPKIPGILEVRNGANTDGTLPYIGTAPAPVTSTTVTITKRQITTFDPANITVTVHSEAP